MTDPVSSPCEIRSLRVTAHRPTSFTESPPLTTPSFMDSVTENPTSLDRARRTGHPLAEQRKCQRMGVWCVPAGCLQQTSYLCGVTEAQVRMEPRWQGRVPGVMSTPCHISSTPFSFLLLCCLFCTFWKRK